MRGYNSANLFFIQKTDLIELQSSRKMNLAGSAETSLCTTNIGESLSQTHSELLSSHVVFRFKSRYRCQIGIALLPILPT
ncbi:hypothetical protein HNY73_004615 [Argiope bruennichi]|uniref:Uncharacterized protein n=1 Tax=Argiope bruennichi TaxID=94029 RepID=A0A8T0FU82_ARGBR|nr:hypothetical protein HNY73_004615 [Argiope bruennichi]